MKSIQINNRIEHFTVYSDYVCPDLTSVDRIFKKIVRIHPNQVKSTLNSMSAIRIANGYVVKIDDMYWYQEHHETWLLQKIDP